jgi:hypothetical protein
VSDRLLDRIQLGRSEIARLLLEFDPLIEKGNERELDVIETAAIASMLHSFYTEIEKIIKMLAQEVDQHVPEGEFWHRDLLEQMTRSTAIRPRVISLELSDTLKEYLAFRHVFRSGSVVLMRWNKMKPLAQRVGSTLHRFEIELDTCLKSLRDIPDASRE